MAGRPKNPHHFQIVAGAVLQRKRLVIDYYNRERNETGQREISPQRLAHYRDNWYLDAWCHQKKALRIFAVECIRAVEARDKPARNIAETSLDKELASAYGIFGGTPKAIAVLVFTAHRARWVADEIWHPKQQTRWFDDGRYELRVPYSDARELAMDIMKYGADVEVIAPAELREQVKERLEAAAGQYRRGAGAGSGFEPDNE